MKTCPRCGITKPESDYQIRRASKDGLAASCRVCLQAYDRSRANLPHRVKAREEYVKTERGRQVSTALKKRWIERNQEKRKAHGVVWNAIKRGKLQQQPCQQCGAQKAEAHHPDYSAPLDVVWLCPAHHKQAHAQARQGN